MKWFIRLIEKVYNNKVDSIGLSVFRLAYSAVLFCEIVQLLYFKHLVFDRIPFIKVNEIDLGLALNLWLLFILFMAIGLFTRIATIVNYLFSLVFIATINSFEYHMFYAYMGINFILMFLPVSTSFSVDRIIERAKYSSAQYTHNPPTTVSVIYYYIPLFLGVGLVYFDSVIFKLGSPAWLSGLGMWKPAVLPHFNHYGESFVLNNKFLAVALGYMTFVFEAIFIFLFWYKPFRIPFLIIGLGLHLGILLFFPIPWFALGVSAIYLLLVPICFWKKLGNFFKSKKQNITFIYDGDCPLCNRTRVILNSLDIFNKIRFVTAQKAKSQFEELLKISNEELITDIHSIDSKGNIRKGVDTYVSVLIKMIYTAPIGLFLKLPGIYQLAKKTYSVIANNRERTPCTDENCVISYPSLLDENKKIVGTLTLKKIRIICLSFFFISVILMQLLVTHRSGIFGAFLTKHGFDQTSAAASITEKLNERFRNFFGICKHPVFMDDHIKGYNHIIAVVYYNNNKEVWLPIIDNNGQPEYYIYGFGWVKWTFRVNSPTITPGILYNGIKRFTAFWAAKNNVDLNDASFKIMVKKIDVPVEWEENFLTKQMEKPWMEADTVHWMNNEFVFTMKDIESM